MGNRILLALKLVKILARIFFVIALSCSSVDIATFVSSAFWRTMSNVCLNIYVGREMDKSLICEIRGMKSDFNAISDRFLAASVKWIVEVSTNNTCLRVRRSGF